MFLLLKPFTKLGSKIEISSVSKPSKDFGFSYGFQLSVMVLDLDFDYDCFLNFKFSLEGLVLILLVV